MQSAEFISVTIKVSVPGPAQFTVMLSVPLTEVMVPFPNNVHV